MKRREQVILGVNQQFLYTESMTSADAHTETLALLADDPRVDALDCWVWADHSRAELAILRSCGKHINYNIGDRFGEKPCAYSTADPVERHRVRDTFRRELDFACEAGARKVVMGSGADDPTDRAGAILRLTDFILEAVPYLPQDAMLTLEPTDRDLDKRFLFGPLEETVEFVKAVRAQGFARFGILLDMGHIPLLYETLDRAVEKTAPFLEHIHLGNCVIRDPQHPLYGDRHVAWGTPGGEYSEADCLTLLIALRNAGYFARGERATVTFETRPFDGVSSDDSLTRLVSVFDDAWRQAFA